MSKVDDALRSLNPHTSYAASSTKSRKAKTSSNDWQTTGASVFGDGQGYKGDNLGKKWKSFAELSNDPQNGTGADFSALGGLKYGTKIEVKNPKTGKTMVLTKRDVGAGGGSVGGKKRGIDLTTKAASYLGIDGLGQVQFRILGAGDKGTPKKALTKALAPTADASAIEVAAPVDLSKPEMTFGAPTISPLVGTDPSNPQGAVNSAVLSTPPPPPVQQTNALAALVAPAALGTTESGGAKPPLDPVKDAKQITAIDKYERRADIIDSRKLPYLWGGGHGAGNAAGLRKYKGPLDCSGAVSKVLGIDPRVSGAFGSWGKGGLRKKGDGVNIYYDDGHVLMGIVRNGKERLWGTSKSNPRGGAGWIDKADIGGAYLNRFKTRHI